MLDQRDFMIRISIFRAACKPRRICCIMELMANSHSGIDGLIARAALLLSRPGWMWTDRVAFVLSISLTVPKSKKWKNSRKRSDDTKFIVVSWWGQWESERELREHLDANVVSRMLCNGEKLSDLIKE